jgi:hypothetical protein
VCALFVCLAQNSSSAWLMCIVLSDFSPTVVVLLLTSTCHNVSHWMSRSDGSRPGFLTLPQANTGIILFFHDFFSFLEVGWDWVHLVRRPLTGLFYQPQMIDYDEYGAVGGIKIGKGNRCTRRKPAPVPLCPPQLPHDLSGTGAGFLRVLRFPLPIRIPPTTPQSSSYIIWGWYNRQNSGSSTKWTEWVSTHEENNKKMAHFSRCQCDRQRMDAKQCMRGTATKTQETRRRLLLHALVDQPVPCYSNVMKPITCDKITRNPI